jgi:hypothetical protein
VLIGAALVAFGFPSKDAENRLLDEYHEQDAVAAG